MLSSISELMLKDSAPVQVCLYSIPVVNIIVRLFQNAHSFDKIGGDYSNSKVDEYEAKKEKFQRSLTTAMLIQMAVAITAFALCILLPSASLVLAKVAIGFGMAALSSYLLDWFLSNCGAETLSVNSQPVPTVHIAHVHLKGL